MSVYHSIDAVDAGAQLARLVDDAGVSRLVPVARLPHGARAGDVVEERDDVFLPAPQETERRRARMAALVRGILGQEPPAQGGGTGEA